MDSNHALVTARHDEAGSRPLYPSYVDLDQFIDVGRLRSLDRLVADGVRRRLARPEDLEFYTGPFRKDEGDPAVPGPRMVYLSRAAGPDNYYDLDRPECWQPTEAAVEFAPLMDFIATLPFKTTGRMLIIYDEAGRAVPAHRDHDSENLCHEFVWFRTNLDKPFFMLDPASGRKDYVTSHAAWFDTVNQFHGADATGRLSISIRVDGHFSDAFRRQFPVCPDNEAAAPAHFARALEERR